MKEFYLSPYKSDSLQVTKHSNYSVEQPFNISLVILMSPREVCSFWRWQVELLKSALFALNLRCQPCFQVHKSNARSRLFYWWSIVKTILTRTICRSRITSISRVQFFLTRHFFLSFFFYSWRYYYWSQVYGGAAGISFPATNLNLTELLNIRILNAGVVRVPVECVLFIPTILCIFNDEIVAEVYYMVVLIVLASLWLLKIEWMKLFQFFQPIFLSRRLDLSEEETTCCNLPFNIMYLPTICSWWLCIFSDIRRSASVINSIMVFGISQLSIRHAYASWTCAEGPYCGVIYAILLRSYLFICTIYGHC